MRLKYGFVLLVLALSVVPGCSDDDEMKSALGELCSGSIPCIDNARCDSRGFCTRDCVDHADCGCREGTTDGDIAARSCPVACENTICVKVCSGGGCSGSTTCVSGPAYDTCV